MPMITWHSGLSVGIDEVDAEHRKLVNMLNHLGDAMRAGEGKAALAKVIGGLVAYTKIHFATEERLFAERGYPRAEAHIQEHRAFTRQIEEFQAGFEAGKLTLSSDVMSFLTTWLRKHIQGSDMEYAKHFAKQAA